MELKVIRNNLFNRDEVKGILEAEKNPSYEELKQEISKEIKKPIENIEVNFLKGSFGSKEFNFNAFVYDTKEDLEKLKPKTRKQRKEEIKAAEEAKKAEIEAKQKSEKPAEEKPIEETPNSDLK